ncbi:MAG TPA: hypothetical protein ENG47_00935 [Candidatus Aerophobetes bacterium]|uniref:ThuA-like domain-containing protein n=1 Tax=Aerophobetes bacterium TaxID=2030807 RepID=A0A7V0MYF4_UNCAE|nr:hypothetical protein [Candidatus Aerophobetes bacterium]
MRKKILGVGLVILFALLVFSENSFAERTKEVAVVEYKKFEWKDADWYYKHYTIPLFNAIKDLGYSPEWVSMDIFLPENKTERDKYKRIVISSAGIWFTPEMYEGMTDYVKSGGLLITNSSLFLVDANRNYKLDEEDTSIKNGFETVGVYGHASVSMNKIKVEVACPLTEGLPIGEWIELKTSGRVTTNKSANVLIIAERYSKKWDDPDYKGWKPPKGNQPFLTYKHLGKGACIYIVPVLDRNSLKNKYLSIILKNALSKKTLEWLTTE